MKQHLSITKSRQQQISEEISVKGFSIISGDAIQKDLLFFDIFSANNFIDSWNNLRLDNYMSDGGKYRYRRYSVFKYESESRQLIEKPFEPHFQEKSVNKLNGGRNRYFEPIENETKGNSVFINLMKFCISILADIKIPTSWHIEAHQFRIIANPSMCGFPTPEGIHRDGVNYVFMMLIGKENIIGGESHIYDNKKNLLFSYMLSNPLDCILLDDLKLMHGVSPIKSLASTKESYRDTLVLTFTELA
ncbi:MAG: 2OG-Fe dioxygenase family protein [Aphanothece sp. CMT-3BRIN-NPC111]|jgi:hypothetical protein|nr:2OG-Fe dioxygenase family protein [Aphanothece sp. CMT-3BRIN-NPC111]